MLNEDEVKNSMNDIFGNPSQITINQFTLQNIIKNNLSIYSYNLGFSTIYSGFKEYIQFLNQIKSKLPNTVFSYELFNLGNQNKMSMESFFRSKKLNTYVDRIQDRVNKLNYQLKKQNLITEPCGSINRNDRSITLDSMVWN